MTIAHIKSNALRRTLLVIAVPLLPVLIAGVSFVVAADAFIEEFKDQWTQGGYGIWDSVRECWRAPQ